jgi:broad specificity phosphatase PhoE
MHRPRATGGSLAQTKRRRTAAGTPAPPPAAARLPDVSFFFGGGTSGNDATTADKRIIFLRHGTTEMNEYLHKQCSYYSPDFKDPLIFDTRLTPDGERRAAAVAERARKLTPRPELVVASPLTRALQTAELAFGPLLDEGVPCLALPLARERLFLSSDVGRNGAELAAEFPRWAATLERLEDGWWRTVDGSGGSGSSSLSGGDDEGPSSAPRRSRRRLRTPTPKPNDAVDEEGDDAFAARMDALGEWLRARPESCVAVVSHWGVIYESTGVEFENVEMRAFRMEQLRL